MQRRHRPTILSPILQQPYRPIHTTSNHITIQLLLLRLPTSHFITTPSNQRRICSNLRSTSRSTIIIRRLFRQLVLLLPTIGPLRSQTSTHRPPRHKQQRSSYHSTNRYHRRIRERRVRVPTTLQKTSTSTKNPTTNRARMIPKPRTFKGEPSPAKVSQRQSRPTQDIQTIR